MLDDKKQVKRLKEAGITSCVESNKSRFLQV